MGKNVVLAGLMGAGKTTVGKLLAEEYGLNFLDVDEFVEKMTGSSISEIFDEYGEKYFRELEKNAILAFAKRHDTVISTGGGAVESKENLKNLQANGIMVYLKASSETLFERVKGEKNRPLLKNENPLETLKELLKKREHNYLKADIIIETDGKSPEEIVKEIGEACKL